MNNTVHEIVLRHENVLNDLLNQMDIPAQRIREAITYSLLSGGKRLRPVLVYLCGSLLKVPQHALDIIAASIELTHCYSLVHDDLPAMDNDDLRRGKPTCHRAFDDVTAILAGDALQILAIDVLLSHLPHSLPAHKTIEIAQILIKASGPSGMISGQSLDLSELKNPLMDETQLRKIHLLKTGELILSCINMVIAAGNPNPQAARSLRKFAQHLGLVFQMQDDYLDVYDNGEQLGKGRASDLANHKTTFATLYNQNDLSNLINEHYQLAQKELIGLGPGNQDLLNLMRSLCNRSHK